MPVFPVNSKYNYHPEFEGYAANVIVKQADVILVGFPLMYQMDKQVSGFKAKLISKTGI